MGRLWRLFPGLVVAGATMAVLWAPSASAVDFLGDACRQPNASGAAACDRGSRYQLTGNNGIIARVTNLIAIISGIAAVIMIVISGFFFITANGDSGKISSAKKTLTYAVIGLVVIALARTIVVFVVGRL
jgi:hypothetical protein